jgi:hypothetical protein
LLLLLTLLLLLSLLLLLLLLLLRLFCNRGALAHGLAALGVGGRRTDGVAPEVGNVVNKARASRRRLSRGERLPSSKTGRVQRKAREGAREHRRENATLL